MTALWKFSIYFFFFCNYLISISNWKQKCGNSPDAIIIRWWLNMISFSAGMQIMIQKLVNTPMKEPTLTDTSPVATFILFWEKHAHRNVPIWSLFLVCFCRWRFFEFKRICSSKLLFFLLMKVWWEWQVQGAGNHAMPRLNGNGRIYGSNFDSSYYKILN